MTKEDFREALENIMDAGLMDDFLAFNDECDRLILEEGMTEEEALEYLNETWEYSGRIKHDER